MKKITQFIIMAGLVTGLSSCEKYLDVNTNPNAATKPPIKGLLSRVTYDAAQNVFRVSNITSYYVQYLSSPNAASPADTYEPIDASGTWTELYDNMSDAYDLHQLGVENGSTQYQGVAKVLQAMDLIHVHDLWGAAPFSNAFTGASVAPTYDNAETIYASILKLLDDGIALLGQTPAGTTLPTDNSDLIHNGNVASWVRTAHALKARMLNRVSKTTNYNASAVLAEVEAAYTAPGQDAAIRTFDVRNPWCQVAVNNQALLLDGWLSEQLIDAMNGKSFGIFDKRLEKMTDPTKFGDYRGTPNGRGRSGSGINNEECYINTTGYYSSTGSPLYIASLEEVRFIEAEAALRAGNRERAYAAYLKGIRESFDKMGVAAADRDAYLNDASVAVGSDALTLELIFKEKYKALFLSPETWSDARRADYQYKDFGLPLNASTSAFVRRLVYPTVETSRNGANAPDITDVTSRLWWDR
ncbi:SusD/RagB family nutrient-binding outer membrane lipoprotein [Flavihumibacter rivuli]|uniref:SusD/RagB family nutrient-binding outer membrane lipoprotein n=1 Tax=Flavihumibacter rivuli TaxID=2838156 RepID=UPI001BDE00FE|nr:SusD/RagB family nutrient-binding outer membrane lipoprotein [Flavihumibacter rivuli]ULQ56111.1 SusD/RagB family nutrient-binding outer membrane lipoprotein [Flavihumibacter rivuli]